MKKIKRTLDLKNNIINYAVNNSKEYILVILIFVIGIFIGVMFINNCSEQNGNSITTYISDFIQKFENETNLNHADLSIESIRNNILLAIIIWLAGTTIIGLPIVLGIILFRGFCLGYTVSSICYTLGLGKGLLFCSLSIFLQNIFFIPALLTIGVSSMKLYKSIINDRRKETIKIEILRHTIISLMMLMLLIFSSFIENEISIKLLKLFINKFN